MKMNKLNFDKMSRDELAHYIVAHRVTTEEIEARRAYIRRLAQKAKNCGIELKKLNNN